MKVIHALPPARICLHTHVHIREAGDHPQILQAQTANTPSTATIIPASRSASRLRFRRTFEPFTAGGDPGCAFGGRIEVV